MRDIHDEEIKFHLIEPGAPLVRPPIGQNEKDALSAYINSMTDEDYKNMALGAYELGDYDAVYSIIAMSDNSQRAGR